MNLRPRILGIGGVPEGSSISELALKTCLMAATSAGADTMMLGGSDLVVPMYNPRDPCRDPRQRRLVDAFRECDGLIIASPCYHGSVSGLIKNALDYIEDLRTDARPYLDGLAVGLIVCAGGSQGAGQVLTSMRGIVHALRGWPTPLGAAINGGGPIFDDDGCCVDLPARGQLVAVAQQVVDHARLRLAAAREAPQQHATPLGRSFPRSGQQISKL